MCLVIVLFLQEDFFKEEEVKEVELGRGNRMRKETNYDDQLSEREWLKAIGVSFYFTPKGSFINRLFLIRSRVNLGIPNKKGYRQLMSVSNVYSHVL